MADNVTLDAGAGGDSVRTKDRSGVETQIVGLDLNIGGAETLMSGSMPVNDNSGSLTVDGTVAVSSVGGTVTVDSELTTADVDTGAGTDTRAVVGLVLGNSGGGLLVGSANPMPVADNGGSLTVDGTVTANAGTGPWPVTDNGGSLTVDNAGTFAVQAALVPQTTGGLTIGPASGAKLLAAASTNATSVKGSAGHVYGWYIFNAAATTRYVKLYNKASSPTVGTDTPVIVIPVPAGAAANVEFTQGIAFGTGIALAMTTGVADSDTGVLTASDVVCNLFFK